MQRQNLGFVLVVRVLNERLGAFGHESLTIMMILTTLTHLTDSDYPLPRPQHLTNPLA